MKEIHLLSLKYLLEEQEPIGTLSGDGDPSGHHFWHISYTLIAVFFLLTFSPTYQCWRMPPPMWTASKPTRWFFCLYMLLYCEYTQASQSAQLTQGTPLALMAKGDLVGLKQLGREFLPSYHLQDTAQTGDWNTPSIFLWKRPVYFTLELQPKVQVSDYHTFSGYESALRECRPEDTIFELLLGLATAHWYILEWSSYTHLEPWTLQVSLMEHFQITWS